MNLNEVSSSSSSTDNDMCSRVGVVSPLFSHIVIVDVPVDVPVDEKIVVTENNELVSCGGKKHAHSLHRRHVITVAVVGSRMEARTGRSHPRKRPPA